LDKAEVEPRFDTPNRCHTWPHAAEFSIRFNQYGVMLVNPVKHPQVKVVDGQTLVDWVTSTAGPGVIVGYKIGGEQVFFPNADK